MTHQLRVTLEVGLKGKQIAAVAADWPGLERGGKTADIAIAKLQSYVPRYAHIAKLAGMDQAFAATTTVDVVEQYSGTGSTDFWGISFAFSSIDQQAMSKEELDRELTLLQACWAFFDIVRFRVSAEMRKGPRGGGRDRDHIVRHTIVAEQDWATGLGLPRIENIYLDEDLLKAHRNAFCHAIREFHSQGKISGKWPLRYLIRHTAYHTLDHAWEMQDKDLTEPS